MLLGKDRCSKCKSERGVRICPRIGSKHIGWKCCNAYRIDMKCPESCAYAGRFDQSKDSPFPAFRADSNTEYMHVASRFIDVWKFQPNAALDGISPVETASSDPDTVMGWLEKFQYPANFPVGVLLDRLGIKHEMLGEPITPESVAFEFMDAVIALDWDKLRPLTVNDVDSSELAMMYEKIMAAIPGLRKTKSYEILHAGAADDGVSAIVVLELNRKSVWTILLSAVSGVWKVRQNFGGSPQLYYAQNALFRNLAESLGNGDEQESWRLLGTNLPSYPDCADLYYYRGLYWQIAKQPANAKKDLWNAMALDNHFFEAGITLSALHLMDKELEQARQILGWLHEDRPEDLNVMNNLAACEAGMGNLNKAKDIWKSLLCENPDYEPAQKNLERYEK